MEQDQGGRGRGGAKTGLTAGSNYNIGQFKLRHPEVYSLSDAGRIMWGKVGGEVLGVVFSLYM